MANTASITVNFVDDTVASFELDSVNPPGSLSISEMSIILSPSIDDTDYDIDFLAGEGAEFLSGEEPDGHPSLVDFASLTEPSTTLPCTCHYPPSPPNNDINIPFFLNAHMEGQQGSIRIDPTFVFKPPGEEA